MRGGGGERRVELGVVRREVLPRGYPGAPRGPDEIVVIVVRLREHRRGTDAAETRGGG